MRTYDIVLFGASGFTGRQAASYFSRHAPPGIRWAVAGRNRTKLESLGLCDHVIVADCTDQPSVDAMAGATRVLVSTAGPFARYGTPIVDACVRHGTHYVDITGETFWVEQLAARYHERAVAEKVRIVPCCGFDSIPSDLGAFLLARHHRTASVRGYFRLGGGGLNGGTVASVSHMVALRQSPAIGSGDTLSPPHYDDWIGTWVGPFFMAPTNTWVVRRTAALFEGWGEPYPEQFRYREFLRFDAPLAAAKAIAVSSAIGLFGLTLRMPHVFRQVERLLPTPGSGPSEKQMDEGWFSGEFIGETGDGSRRRAVITNRGDAGNRSTVKMLGEAAFCQALGASTDRGGILTPATAFGDHLVQRLRAAGMAIDLHT